MTLAAFGPAQTALNGICPYFTMFPLTFPLGVLSRATREDRVLDPFCGRGTTNFAARLLGLESVGIDSSPVAAAITAAKLVDASPEEIVGEAEAILARKGEVDIPGSEFWRWAFNAETLRALCRLRAVLLDDCTTASRIALRGIVLGALHGPRQKAAPSYLSNQSPRTYAPKPAYAVRFWRSRQLTPPYVNLIDVFNAEPRDTTRKAPAPLGSPASGTAEYRQLLRTWGVDFPG